MLPCATFISYFGSRFSVLPTLLLILLAIVDAKANGSLVLAGEPRPEPYTLNVAGGKPTTLDVLTSAAIPTKNQCRTSLYALGGPIVAKISEQTGPLLFVNDGKNSYRASISLEIPPAKPGARFLIKTECLSPTPQILGTVQLQVPEFDPLDEIRLGLEGHEVQVSGQSIKLRALLKEWLIPFKDHTNAVPGAIVLSEGPADTDQAITTTPYIFVEFSISIEQNFSLIGQKLGNGWKVEARLPRSARLSGPDAASQLADIIRFIHKLETPRPNIL